MNDTNIPTVHLLDLVPDRCNFMDRTFEKFVRQFMRDFMPGLSRMMLEDKQAEFDEDGYGWAVIPRSYQDLGLSVECQDDPEDPEEEVYVLWEEPGSFVTPGDDYPDVDPYDYPDPDGVLPSGVPFWRDEADAEEVAETIAREESQPTLGAYPWAWNWSWMPDDRIHAGELREAGFMLATYTNENAEWTFAGIDGGGYSFEGAHFARLCAIVHENRARYGWTVETDNGPAYITTKPRGEE
jgi:hypothetical protein